jgi:hypothetical protein
MVNNFKSRSQGATEYLLILTIVLVVTALSIYYLTRTKGPPTLVAYAEQRNSDIVLEVTSGEVAAGEWAYRVYVEGTTPPSYTTGNVKLDPDSDPVLLSNPSPGTYLVDVKHIDTGHLWVDGQKVVVGG